MTGQIHEYVDTILHNACDNLVIIHIGDAAPVISISLEAFGDSVMPVSVGITGDFKVISVVCPQYRFKKAAYRMKMKIGGNVTDAQGPFRIAQVVVDWQVGITTGELLVPCLMCGKQAGSVRVGIIVHA